MAAVSCTAVMVAMIAGAHATTDGTKRTTVDGPSLALNDIWVTTSKASGEHNAISSIGQRDTTSNENIDFHHRYINALGKQIFNRYIQLFKAALSKSAAQRTNIRKHANTLSRTNQGKRFAGWFYSSRSRMFRSDLG